MYILHSDKMWQKSKNIGDLQKKRKVFDQISKPQLLSESTHQRRGEKKNNEKRDLLRRQFS